MESAVACHYSGVPPAQLQDCPSPRNCQSSSLWWGDTLEVAAADGGEQPQVNGTEMHSDTHLQQHGGRLTAWRHAIAPLWPIWAGNSGLTIYMQVYSILRVARVPCDTWGTHSNQIWSSFIGYIKMRNDCCKLKCWELELDQIPQSWLHAPRYIRNLFRWNASRSLVHNF